MKRKVRFIAALFCMGCLVTEPAADIKAAGIQVAAAQTTLSADNSLEVLSLSAGTLSPDFTGKTVQYTATVPNDVTSVTVTATPVNEFATVQSITGNDNLQVGTNTIKVVVKAQNGALAQYTITLTREDGQTADGTVDQPADGTDGQTTDQPADGTDSQTTDQPALRREIPGYWFVRLCVPVLFLGTRRLRLLPKRSNLFINTWSKVAIMVSGGWDDWS